jgi:hypothetical protein
MAVFSGMVEPVHAMVKHRRRIGNPSPRVPQSGRGDLTSPAFSAIKKAHKPMVGRMDPLRKRRLTIFRLGLWIVLTTTGCRAPSAVLTELVSFEMEDQFRNVYSHRDYAGRVLILIGSDRDGSRYAREWGKALDAAIDRDGAAPDVDLVGFSDLRGVPFFLKGYVRGKFPREEGESTLLDWSGVFADSYDFVSGTVNIFVFDRRGRLIHTSHVKHVAEADLTEIVSIIRKAVKDRGH